MGNRLRRRWVRRLQAVVLMLAPVALLVGSARLLADVGRPFDGMLTYNNIIRGVYEMDEATPSWWIVPHNGPLTYGAAMRAADDAPYARAPEVFARLWEAGARRVRLSAIVDDALIDVTVPLHPFTLANFLDLRLPNIILSVCLMLLAYVLYRADSDAPLADVLIFTAALGAINFGMGDPSLFWLEGPVSRVINLLSYAVTALISLSLVTIGALFIGDRLRVLRWALVSGTAGWAVVSFALWVRARALFFSEGETDLVRAADGAAYYTLNTLLAFANITLGVCLMGYLLLAHIRRRPPHTGPPHTVMARAAWTLALGFFLSQPGLMIGLLNSLFDLDLSRYAETLDLRYSVLFFPLFGMLALARYRLFGARSWLITLAGIMAVAGLLASALNAIILKSILPPVVYANLPAPFAVIFGGLMVTGIFWAFQRDVRAVWARRLNARGYRADALNVVLDDLRRLEPGGDLPARIVTTLRDRLDLSRVVLWTATGYDEHQGIPFRHVTQTAPDEPAARIGPKTFTLEGHEWPYLAEGRVIVLEPNREVPLPPDLRPLHLNGTLHILLPLDLVGRPVGMIGLTLRRDLDTVDTHDLDVLFQAGQQIAYVLALTRQTDTITETRNQLHNGLQNRLPWVSRRLADLRGRVTPEIWPVIQEAQREIDQMTAEVRAIARGQRANALTDLETLLHDFHVRTEIDVQHYIDDALTDDPDLGARIYGWVSEILTNVEKYAQAERVLIIISRHSETITLIVQDNGVGIPDNAWMHAPHIGGLRRMQASVARQNGTMQVINARMMNAGLHGTRIMITLPAL